MKFIKLILLLFRNFCQRIVFSLLLYESVAKITFSINKDLRVSMSHKKFGMDGLMAQVIYSNQISQKCRRKDLIVLQEVVP